MRDYLKKKVNENLEKGHFYKCPKMKYSKSFIFAET